MRRRSYKKPWKVTYDPTRRQFGVYRVKPEPFNRETRIEYEWFDTFAEADDLRIAMNNAEGLA